MSNADYTYYGGGHRGTEAEFGQLAEQYGLREVNFTFDGQEPGRKTGEVHLSPEELAKGDISMEIVSIRMNRKYSQVQIIRRVFQLIFHMVNNGFQIFTVGWIQDDKTVKGGTGWAVELGKLFNRPQSVFDQDKNKWFTWKDNEWVEDLPTVDHKTFVGTGTRNLTDGGKKAIEELFARSFSA
jgi:hypothetical protein